MDAIQQQLATLIYPLAIAFVLVLAFNAVQPRKSSPDEPPIIPTRLPYIGHAIGMFRHGGRYFRMLRRVQPLRS
jgi:hypothetical protein